MSILKRLRFRRFCWVLADFGPYFYCAYAELLIFSIQSSIFTVTSILDSTASIIFYETVDTSAIVSYLLVYVWSFPIRMRRNTETAIQNCDICYSIRRPRILMKENIFRRSEDVFGCFYVYHCTESIWRNVFDGFTRPNDLEIACLALLTRSYFHQIYS